MQQNIIIEKLGERINVEIIVDITTQRLQLEDELQEYFKTKDIKEFKEQMQNFLIILFGDATNDSKQSINNAYESLGISLYWLVEGLKQTMNELGISEEIKTEVIEICQSIGIDVQRKHSLYDRLGGGLGIRLMVDKLIEIFEEDQKLKGFFTKTDTKKLNQQMQAFLTMLFGGPSNYFGKSMIDAHKGLGINDEYFDLVVKHLCDTLNNWGALEDDVTEVVEVCESIRDDVLGK